MMMNETKSNTEIMELEATVGFTRVDFINRTGIFITLEHFGVICKEFKDSNKTVDEFLATYDHPGVIELPLTGTFKYFLLDDNLSCIGDYCDMEDEYEPNLYELMNCLANAYTAVRKRAEITDKIRIGMAELDKEVENIKGMILNLN